MPPENDNPQTDQTQDQATPPPSDTPLWQQALEGDDAEGQGAAEGEGGSDHAVIPTKPAAGAAQVTPPLTPELLQQLMTGAATSAVQATQAQQQPQGMTEEEFRRVFNVYNPDKALFDAMGWEMTPEKVAILTQAFQGSARQAATMAAYQLEAYKQEIAKRLAPIAAYMEEAQMEKQKSRFLSKYPDLKGLEPLLVRIKDSFIREGRRFKTEDEAFQAVAEAAREVKQQILSANGGAAVGQSQTQRQPTSSQRMAPLSGGGQGGAGDSGAAGAEKPYWQKVLG